MSITGRYITMRGGNIIGTPPNNIPTPYTYLVDAYSPIVAYSFWKLNSTSTVCLRVRRSNDNAEQDIGFDGNYLDVASMLSFVGANDGFGVKWYNQGIGGATYEASQGTATAQMQIVSSGVFLNGFINISNDRFLLASPISSTQLFYSSTVYNRILNTDRVIALGGSAYPFTHAANDNIQANMNGVITNITAQNITGLKLFTSLRNSSDLLTGYLNGSLVNSLSYIGSSGVIDRIGNISTTYSSVNIPLVELIYHNGDLELNRLAIESNINSRYGIY